MSWELPGRKGGPAAIRLLSAWSTCPICISVKCPITCCPEITDIVPDWHPCFGEYYDEVFADTAAWAKRCVDKYGADLVQLRLLSADPDLGDSSPEECAETVKKVLEAVGVPLIVVGSGKAEKDDRVYPVIAEAAAGENLLLGVAEVENYKAITSAMATSMCYRPLPVDINIWQLNILIAR